MAVWRRMRPKPRRARQTQADRWAEHEGMADHQRQPIGVGQLQQLLRLIDGRRQRFFDEHMFLRFERALHQRVV